MKILYMNHRGGIGGGEISWLQFLDEFTRRYPHEVMAALGEDGPLAEQLARRGIPYTVLPFPAFRGNIIKALRAAALLQLNHDFQPDIIHAQTPRAAGYAGRIRGPRQKAVWHLRTVGRWGYKEKAAAGKTDAIITISRAVADCVPPKLAARTRVIVNGVLPPGTVGESAAEVWRQALKLPAHLPLIGVIGRLDHRKGLPLLLETAKALQAVREAGWIIAGDGPLRNELVTLASSLGVEHIVFAGHLADTAPFWQACQATVTASESEGFGRTVVESVLAGCPPFYFPIEGLAELGLPASCLLTERTPATIAAQLANHLRNPQQLRQELVPFQEQFRQRFSVRQHTAAVAALYDELFAGADIPVFTKK